MSTEQRSGSENINFSESKVLNFSRNRINEDITEALQELEDMDIDPKEKRLFLGFINHAKSLSMIDSVSGVLFRLIDQTDEGFGQHLNVLTVTNRLFKDDPITIDFFRRVGETNVQLWEELKDVVSFGSSSGQCGDSFDDYVSSVLDRESRELQGRETLPSGNDLVDFIREMNSGYTTIFAMKFE
jgi:hypothetical protein